MPKKAADLGLPTSGLQGSGAALGASFTPAQGALPKPLCTAAFGAALNGIAGAESPFFAVRQRLLPGLVPAAPLTGRLALLKADAAVFQVLYGHLAGPLRVPVPYRLVNRIVGRNPGAVADAGDKLVVGGPHRFDDHGQDALENRVFGHFAEEGMEGDVLFRDGLHHLIRGVRPVQQGVQGIQIPGDLPQQLYLLLIGPEGRQTVHLRLKDLPGLKKMLRNVLVVEELDPQGVLGEPRRAADKGAPAPVYRQ